MIAKIRKERERYETPAGEARYLWREMSNGGKRILLFPMGLEQAIKKFIYRLF